MTSLVDRLLPDALWQRIQPLLPPVPARPRGGVPRRLSDRNCAAALIFMARTSTPWSLLPAQELGCGSASSRWRRLDEWTRAGVFDQLHAVLLDELGRAGRVDLERVRVDSFSLRAVKGGDLTGAIRWIVASEGPSCIWLATATDCRSRWCSAPPTPTTPRCSRPW